MPIQMPGDTERKRLAGALLTLCLATACGGGSGSGTAAPIAPSPMPQPVSTACAAGERNTTDLSIGHNVNVLFWEGLYADPSMLAAVRSLGAPTLRYPGGTESDYFDWSAGRPVEACRYGGCRNWDTLMLRPPALYQGFSTFSQGTPRSFAGLVSAAQGTPLFVANMVTASADDMISWLGLARSAGMSVAKVELGNEPYFGAVAGTDNNAAVFADAASHVTAAHALATRVRSAFPGVRVAQPAYAPRVDAVTGQLDPSQDQRMLSWNDRLVAAGATAYADAFALHLYPRLPARAGTSDAAYLAELGAFSARTWRATRATPQWRALPADRSLWITEFNFSFAQAAEIAGTWMHGLLMAQFAVQSLQDARVDMVLAHMVTGSVQWQAVVHPGRAPYVAPAPGFRPYALTASGRALSTVASGLAGGRCGRVALAEITTASPDRVAAWLVTQGGPQRLVVINADATSLSVDLTAAGWHTASGQVLSASPLQRITDPSLITATPVSASPARFQVPAHSIAMVERSR